MNNAIKKVKLVPVKATPEILAAIERAYPGDVIIDGMAEGIWDAAIAAATVEPEIVCWVPLFAGSAPPYFDLAERTKEELELNLADEEGKFVCLPLIVKPD